jgi:hypothetical protein
MCRTRRGIVLALTSSLLLGCRLSGPLTGQTGGVVRPTREPALAAEVTLEVVAKRDPDTLVARDGTSCLVAADVFANTRVGSLFRCRWVRS